MKSHAIVLVCPILASPVFSADSSILREIMGETVYQQAGIQELSEQQIEVLEQWILDNTVHHRSVRQPPAAPEPPPPDPDSDVQVAADDDEGRPTPEPRRVGAPEAGGRNRDVIRSRIDGPFKGWRNNGTRFRLENGEIWEQRQAGTFITDLDSPEVIIRRNRFGYTMEVPQIGRKVHVKRIR